MSTSAPAALAAACERLDAATAPANWEKRLSEGGEGRAAALAVLRVAAVYPGPAMEQARELIAAAPEGREEGAEESVTDQPPS